jgi:hypothetical protein
VAPFYTFMPRAKLCRAEREQLQQSLHISITCPIYRGAYIRHNPGGICSPKCGKQTPFIPSEVRKNFIGGLLPDLYSLSMAPDYAAQKRAKSQRYHRIAAVTQDNQGRDIKMYMPCTRYARILTIPLVRAWWRIAWPGGPVKGAILAPILHHIPVCPCLPGHPGIPDQSGAVQPLRESELVTGRGAVLGHRQHGRGDVL